MILKNWEFGKEREENSYGDSPTSSGLYEGEERFSSTFTDTPHWHTLRGPRLLFRSHFYRAKQETTLFSPRTCTLSIFFPYLQANRSIWICFTSLLPSPFSCQKDGLQDKACWTTRIFFFCGKNNVIIEIVTCACPPLRLLIYRSLIRVGLMYSIHKKAETSKKICSVLFSSCFINKEQNVSRLSVTYAPSDFKPDWASFQMRVIIHWSNNNAFFYCFACKVVSMFCEDKVICHFCKV